MPKRRYGKLRKRTVRKRIKKRKSRSRAKFTSKVPRSISGFKQLSFPSILKRTIRVCYSMVLKPEFTALTNRWNGVLNFKCNGLNAPFEPDTPQSINLFRVPNGLDDYARVYTAYRVNSSKCYVRCYASPLPEDFEQTMGPTTVNTGPAYVCLRRRLGHHEELDMSKFSVATCRENGFRFIKVDPSQATGPATTTWSGIGGRDYAHSENGTSLSAGYKAKYAKNLTREVAGVPHREDTSPHNSSITGDPGQLQYFQISLVQPDDYQVPIAVLPHNPPAGGYLAPTPVLCSITINYNVTFWRKTTLQPKTDHTAVLAAAAASGQP